MGLRKLRVGMGTLFFSILFFKNVFIFLFFWLHHATCRIFFKKFYGMLPDTFIDWGAALEAIVRRENVFLPRGDENAVL